ncbi:enkurin-like [Dysidea avara]|uniref:enkurin-like n=1 Tax=Dysidea avara TaxID=196820 RepID=UPI003325C67D
MAAEVEESIYNLIPKPVPPLVKPPRHTSKFNSSVRNEVIQTKSPAKTMGPAKVNTGPEEGYLRKNDRTLPEKRDFKYPNSDKRKPAVPRASDKPLMGTQSNKNFVSTNATTAIMSVPRKPVAHYVDTCKGQKHPLDPSGLTPHYTNKSDYGILPDYIQQRQKEVAQAQAEYDKYIEETMRQGALLKVSDDERKEILAGLKKNWEQLHHQYQGLSVVTDTVPKKARKEHMEAEMKQLEQDIAMVEKHQLIYLTQETR